MPASKLQYSQEMLQSGVSYCTAGVGCAVVTFLEMAAGPAEALTIILATVAIALRIAYDGIRLVRYWRKDKDV